MDTSSGAAKARGRSSKPPFLARFGSTGMSFKLPLPPSFFQCTTLTRRAEVDYYHDMGVQSVRNLIDKVQLIDGSVHWTLHASEGDLNVKKYKGDSPDPNRSLHCGVLELVGSLNVVERAAPTAPSGIATKVKACNACSTEMLWTSQSVRTPSVHKSSQELPIYNATDTEEALGSNKSSEDLSDYAESDDEFDNVQRLVMELDINDIPLATDTLRSKTSARWSVN
ncbi:hypothetical protein AeNC1_011876 [Aphanomyces euteiches]|nr:hypothetical protein AeNC1_011876 [Aphanomyces euteiches]